MHVDEAVDRLFYRLQADQRHLPVFGEELEAFDGGVFAKGVDEVFFGGVGRNVGQMQRRRRCENIRIIFRSLLLEAM